MRRIAILTALATICLAAGNPVVGTWAVTSDDGNGGVLTWTLIVKQEGVKLSGLLTGGNGDLPLIEPKLEGKLFTFKLYISDNCTVETKLKVEGNKFEGTFGCPEVTGTMKGARQR
jgi:hypothetical protein